MSNRNISLQHHSLAGRDLNKKLFQYLLWVALAGVLIYMYFIGSIVFNVVARKGIEAENHTLTSELAQMQVKYLATMGNIDMDYAKSIGFQEPTNRASYVKNTSQVGTLLGASDEI